MKKKTINRRLQPPSPAKIWLKHSNTSTLNPSHSLGTFLPVMHQLELLYSDSKVCPAPQPAKGHGNAKCGVILWIFWIFKDIKTYYESLYSIILF